MKKIIPIILFCIALLQGCTTSEFINRTPVDYPLAGLSLSKTKLSDMIVGETRNLSVLYSPAEAADKRVQWASSDEDVAVISETGVLTATGLGEAVVSVVSLSDNSKRDSCFVSVTLLSGISVLDPVSGDVVGDSLFLVKNISKEKVYKVYSSVHNSYDHSFTVESTDTNVAIVAHEMADSNEFTLSPGPNLGKAQINIRSNANPELVKSIIVEQQSTYVKDVSLSLNEDGSDPAKTLNDSITISYSKRVYVVFTTNMGINTIPENTKATLTSSDPTVATVDAQATFDPDRMSVWFDLKMIDDKGNVPEEGPAKKTEIEVTTDDGGYKAKLIVTAKCPKLESFEISMAESDPIHAGDSLQLFIVKVPEDAYQSDIAWSSLDESVATVDNDGMVKICPDFVFDPENPEATEIMIRASVASDPTKYKECKLKPYQWVTATGVMVTDQWGNRMRFTSDTNLKVTDDNTNVCMQYCTGSGTAGTTNLNEVKTWGKPSIEVAGVEQVGSIALYFTATPYPYTYPTITDPDQPFYWCTNSSQTRFQIPAEGHPNGDTAKGWPGVGSPTKAQRMFLGHTCKVYTGHASSSTSIQQLILYRYDPDAPNNTDTAKWSYYMGVIMLHGNAGKDYAKYDNPNMKIDDNIGLVYNFVNTDGLPKARTDKTPEEWDGPMPTPGVWYTLKEDGTPDKAQTWGDIPVPDKITSVKRKKETE